MKCLLLLAALAASFLLPLSCANNSSAATGVPAAAGSSAASGVGSEGSFTYTTDGVKTVVKPPATSLYLNEVSHNAANGTVKIEVTIFPAGEVFKFSATDRGKTDVVNYRPSFTEEKIAATYMYKLANYYADHVSITISALDAAHVAGTFSGTFKDKGKTVKVTDGSFDLPMKAKN